MERSSLYADQSSLIVKTRFGLDSTWTGNDNEVLKLLFSETVPDKMGPEAMNMLVEEYAGSDRFVDRLKNMTVVRWLSAEDEDKGMIPFEDLLRDWYEIGLIPEQTLKDSLVVRKYEQAIATDVTIQAARREMAADLCVDMSLEDAIFNGVTGVKVK